MTFHPTRRRFLLTSFAVAGVAGLWQREEGVGRQSASSSRRPLAICSANRVTTPDGTVYYGGIRATQKAIELIRAGSDPLEAVIAGVTLVEDDPNDMSVGYGGLPNEEGEVELDAQVMHGPTGRCGAVAALKYIKNPSQVARLVMEKTDHVLLVGEGALRFALAFGFKKENLLTERAREMWLRWREQRSTIDHWVDNKISSRGESSTASPQTFDRDRYTGSISCLAVDAAGNLAGVSTTSGLAFKVPGRVGDLAVIGAGLFVDNEVGAAGSTGWGEDNIRVAGAHTIVEHLRRGMSPTDACLEALKRVARLYNGKPEHQLKYYALTKDGQFGSASMWKGEEFVVADSGGSRVEPAAYLYEKKPD